MSRLSSSGLVISTRDYRDRDRWVTILTSDRGRVDLLAKGVRTLSSKRRGSLLPGSQVRFSWTSKGETNILTEVVLEHSLHLCDSTLERMRDLQAVLEILFHLSIENIDQSDLYQHGVELLNYIAETNQYNRGVIRMKLRAMSVDQGFDEVDDDSNLSATTLVEEFIGRKLRSFAYLRV